MQPIVTSVDEPPGVRHTSTGSFAGDVAPAVAAGVVVLAARVAAFAGDEGRHFLLDDAFISFRYARNLADGLGLVFNEGERVEGYTNFLWTVMLAAAARLGFDIVSTSVVLALLSTIGTIVVLAAFGRILFAGRPHAPVLIAIAPLLFALFGGQSRYVMSGMETSFFVLLVTLGVYLAVAAGRPLAGGLVFAAAALTRPEGALFFGVVLLFQLTFARPRVSERLPAAGWLLGAFAAVVAPYIWWRIGYYGSPLPNSFYVKSGGEITELLLRRGWAHLVFAVQQSALLLPAIVAVAGIVLRRERLWFVVGGLTAAAAAEVILVGGDFQFFFGPRLLMPVLPCVYLATAAGVAALAERVTVRPALRLLTAVGLTGILAVYIGWNSWPARDPNLQYVTSINQGWTELGKWLKAHAEPDAVVAVGAVGRIPYYSGHRTIDMLGLTDPHIGRRDITLGAGMPGHEKYDTPYVLGRKPDYVIFVLLGPTGEPAVQDWSLVADRFTFDYELVALVKAGEFAGPWVLDVYSWSPELASRGYQGGVYRRRE